MKCNSGASRGRFFVLLSRARGAAGCAVTKRAALKVGFDCDQPPVTGVARLQLM